VRHPTVSVIIPFYNREMSVVAATESVLRQSFSDIEVILINDASTDGSAVAVKMIGDSRIRLLTHEQNQGASAARNTGIAAATGEWIAFQDSDDFWLPEKLQRQMEALTSSGTEFVAGYCGMLIKHMGVAKSNRIEYLPGHDVVVRDGDILESLMKQSFVSTQTLIVRRSTVSQTNGFDADLPALEDWEFMLRVAQLGPVAFVDEPLVHQQFSANSITRSAQKRLDARRKILHKHRSLLERRPDLLAEHHYTIAGALRRGRHFDDFPEMRQHLTAAITLMPGDLRYRAMGAWIRILELIVGRRSRP
jgi:glycosyltransferase involved in cell wall biosynthesis